MKSKTGLLLIFWLVFATVFVGLFLTKNYHLIGFYYPESFTIWINNLIGTSNAEEVADLGLILNFLVGLITSSVIAFVVYVFIKYLKR